MMTPEEYIRQVRVLLAGMQRVLTTAEKSEVEHLIDHDEPTEGLRTLAWIIHDEGKDVSAASVAEMLSLIGDMIDEEDLPPGFKDYAKA